MHSLNVGYSSFISKIYDVFSRSCVYTQFDINYKGVPPYSSIDIYTFTSTTDNSRHFRLKWNETKPLDGSGGDWIFHVHPLSLSAPLKDAGFNYAFSDRPEGVITIYKNHIVLNPWIDDPAELLVRDWLTDFLKSIPDDKRTLYYALREHAEYPSLQLKFGALKCIDGRFRFIESHYHPPERKF